MDQSISIPVRKGMMIQAAMAALLMQWLVGAGSGGVNGWKIGHSVPYP